MTEKCKYSYNKLEAGDELLKLSKHLVKLGYKIVKQSITPNYIEFEVIKN